MVTKEAPATWVTSLVEWLGVHNMELHLSGPEYSGMLTQQDLPPTETPTQYRSSGIATVSELPTSTEEVLLRATQCWLIPEPVDGNRVVFEVLGFTAAAGGEAEQANVLTWTRAGPEPLRTGDILRTSLSGLHRGTVTGLTREVALFAGQELDLVQLSPEAKGELSRSVVSITPKRISVECPDPEPSAG